jgi:hypothetical protein
LAVTRNSSVTEADVRQIIDFEVSRSPNYRRASDAIECVRIAYANVDPSTYEQDVADIYQMSMEAQEWKSVRNLHIFEYLETPPIYVAFPI